MKLLKFGSVVFMLALVLGVTGIASAAVTEQSFGFKVNDKFNDSVGAGSTVKVTSAWDVTAGDQMEYLRTRAYNSNGDIVADDCESVGTIQDANDRSISISLEIADDQPEGNLTIKQLAFGDPTLGRSPGCDLAFDYGSETNHAGNLFIDDELGNTDDNAGNSGPGGSGSNTGGSSNNTNADVNPKNGIPDWFDAWVKSQQGSSTPGTANTAKCSTVAPYRNAPAYVYSTAGQQLQSALTLDNPHAIPALDVTLHPTGTVPLGFFGIQTHAALAAFDSMYHCI